VKRGATNVLDQYDFEVLRTWKVRGAIVCETNQGLYILKEFNGCSEKVMLQNLLLKAIREKGFQQAEMLLANKEGLFITLESDGTKYMMKTYLEGQECDVDNIENCKKAMEGLAKYHNVAAGISEQEIETDQLHLSLGIMDSEFEKHNRELKKVRSFLKRKGQKNDFEHFLVRHYDFYLEKAIEITELLKEQKQNALRPDMMPCHGDFQYHNILFQEEAPFLINFEKCIWDDATRDICYFLRKVLEKHNWSMEIGDSLLNAYHSIRTIPRQEREAIYYRFSYPEKFWKIVNFYYNSGKSFIPGKNAEKLEMILQQEKRKQEFIKVVL